MESLSPNSDPDKEATDANNSPENPVSQGDAKIGPETILSPEQMLSLTRELLIDVGAEFPAVGDIPVELNTDEDGQPKDGFVSSLTAKAIYTPAITPRPLYDPTKRTGPKDERPKDFATWFMQVYGKTVTMRLRGPQTLKDSEQRHKEVPKITREFLCSEDEDERIELTQQLSNVIAHNMEKEFGLDDEKTVMAIRAHIWMLNKLSAMIALVEATE